MCAILANTLEKEGHNVIVVSTDKPYGAAVQFEISPSIRCYSLKGNRVEQKLGRMRWTKSYEIWKYRAILWKHRISLVIDVDIHLSLITAPAIKGSKIKDISWDHFNYERFIARPSREPLHRCFMESVDRLVVLTKYDQRAYVEREHLPAALITQIYNPCPIRAEEYTPHTAHRVLAVGRLAFQKGFDLLLDAWAEVEAVNGDWELEIVGSGQNDTMLHQLQEQAERLRLQRVIFTPFTPNIKEKYAGAGIYVLSSRYEGFGLVLIEAMTMSLPPVSFNCKAGPDEIITDGHDGLLVEPENTHALAESLLRLINDDQLRDRMSRNAFAASQRYRIEYITQQWVSLIQSL